VDVENALARFCYVKAVMPFLIREHTRVAPYPVQGRKVPPNICVVFDLDKTFVDQSWDKLTNGFYIDAGFGSDALKAVMNQPKFSSPLVLCTPEEVVYLFFNKREGILSLRNAPDTTLFKKGSDAFCLPERLNAWGRYNTQGC